MKSFLTLGIVALLAVPVFAEEPKKSEDSPLVAAAKKSRERRKKPAATVITNDTLARSNGKGHLTTTAQQREIKMPEVLPPVEPTDEQRAAKVIELKNQEAAT
ncbi:MAG TPA: hypothetical protein VF111_09855, partial [Thermoanaerobaculia bacterium]